MYLEGWLVNLLKIVEAFSGLGSQAKALSNLGVTFEVLNTIDWDINAIYAYDILHNGEQNLLEYEHLSKNDLLEILSKYDLSANGKEPLNSKSLSLMKRETLMRIYASIKRSSNLVNIQQVTAKDFTERIDLFTYSFPCQDLSLSGNWHGNEGGIDRDANNRSSMLWEVERILFEMRDEDYKLPKFMLMENVTAIRSSRHIKNFKEWKNVLESLGYVNIVYDLNAIDFGIPQNRKRTFMISVLVDDLIEKNLVLKYFDENNLEKNSKLFTSKKISVKDILKLDYSNTTYMKEALISIPNETKSRKKIYLENPKIYKTDNYFYRDMVRTITTKQDRHPNSGVIEIDFEIKGKSKFRYLTPRECFMFMGFAERDFQRLVDNNFSSRKNTDFLTRDKLNKLAGNSIVVPVLESVFSQILEVQKLLIQNK